MSSFHNPLIIKINDSLSVEFREILKMLFELALQTKICQVTTETLNSLCHLLLMFKVAFCVLIDRIVELLNIDSH